MTLLRAGQDDDKLDGGGRGSAAGESGEAGVGGVGGDLQGGARRLHRAGRRRRQHGASDLCRRISARAGDCTRRTPRQRSLHLILMLVNLTICKSAILVLFHRKYLTVFTQHKFSGFDAAEAGAVVGIVVAYDPVGRGLDFVGQEEVGHRL